MEEAGRLCWELAKASVWGQTLADAQTQLNFQSRPLQSE